MWKQTSGSLNQLPKPWFKDTSGPTSNLWVALKERKWARTRDLLGTLVECPTWKPRPFLSFSLSQEPYKRLTGSPVCSLPSPPVDCFQANYGRLARTRDSGTPTRLACTGGRRLTRQGQIIPVVTSRPFHSSFHSCRESVSRKYNSCQDPFSYPLLSSHNLWSILFL